MLSRRSGELRCALAWHHARRVHSLRRADGLDLARVKVVSPFVRTMKLGLGPCFQFLLAHERRHLWQAWQVRNCDAFPPANTPQAESAIDSV